MSYTVPLTVGVLQPVHEVLQRVERLLLPLHVVVHVLAQHQAPVRQRLLVQVALLAAPGTCGEIPGRRSQFPGRGHFEGATTKGAVSSVDL